MAKGPSEYILGQVHVSDAPRNCNFVRDDRRSGAPSDGNPRVPLLSYLYMLRWAGLR